MRREIDPRDMHRMEQLAEAAAIALVPETNRVILNEEDVTEEIREPRISESGVAGGGHPRRAPRHGREAARDRGERRTW